MFVELFCHVSMFILYFIVNIDVVSVAVGSVGFLVTTRLATVVAIGHVKQSKMPGMLMADCGA